MKIIRKSPVDLNLKSTPQQTVLWSEVKKKQGYRTHSFQLKTPGELISRQLKGRTLADDILIIEQALDNENSIGYIPYGPQIEPDEDLQGTFLEELSESLRPLLPEKCCTLRYDLKWESLWAKDEDLFEHNIWSGPPAPENQEIRLNFNTHNHNLRKSLSDNLPAHIIF